MRRVAAILLLLLIFSNILTPLLTSYAENQPESESFWEKVEDKIIEYAYMMAEKREFINYLFIPGVGGGKQELGGTSGLYAILILLPSIESKDSEPTEKLLEDILKDFGKVIINLIASGKGINDVIGAFYNHLSQNAERFGRSVVSFYLPYQKLMFRVIAIVWIQAENLLNAGINMGISPITEKVIGASFHFMKALVDKQLDELMKRIVNKINATVNPAINNVEKYISVKSTCTEIYEPIYDEEGNKIGERLVGYNVIVTASPFSEEIENLIKNITDIVGKIKKLSELGYNSFMDIIETYDDVTEGTKGSDMYDKLFTNLKNGLEKVIINIGEIENMLRSVPIYIDSRICKDCGGDCKTSLENQLRNDLKTDLIRRLEEIRDNYLKKPFEEFLIDKIKTPLINTLNPLFDKAEKMVKEIVVDAAGNIASDVVTKIPIVGAVYTVANAIHQVFAQTLTEFDYEISPPEASLKELEGGEVQYFEEGEIVKDTVHNKQWWQGCIKAAMTAILQMISSEASKALNYIPQIFVFDLNFSKSKQGVTGVITGGRPGIYMLNGSIKFKNVYSNIGDFFGKVGEGLTKSPSYYGSKESKVYHYLWCYHVKQIKPENRIEFKDECDAAKQGYRPCEHCKPPACGESYTFEKEKYSIFTEDIAKSLPSSEEEAGGEEVKFAIPYIVASALPVIKNVDEIDEHLINVKMAAIMDIGSFIKPIIREVKEELKEKLNEGAEKFIDKVEEVLKEKICGKITNFLNEIFEKTMKKIFETDSLLGNILEFITGKLVDTITNKITQAITDAIITKIKEEISKVLRWIYEKMDITSEKLEEFISITASVIAIPARGMDGKLNITIYSLGISKSIDGLGYCRISLRKDQLIVLSALVSAAGSYVAFSNEGSIGMIPYSTHSYEPFIVQVFTEVSPQSNTFRVKWISDPKKDLQGVSIETREMPDGIKLVMLRDSSQARAESMKLRYVPNPYPYAEAYVSLKIAE